LRESVYVSGAAMSRFGVHPDQSVASLTQAVVSEALADAGLGLDAVGAVYFGNTTQSALEGQLMVGGQIALRRMGLQAVPVFNVENACATGASALHLAIGSVLAGTAAVALAVGVEKMNIGDRARSMAVFDGAYDVSDPDELVRQLERLGGVADATALGDRSIFMDIYAAFARAHMKAFGTTQEQIAAVSAKNHGHAVHNERAHYRTAMTVADVLHGRELAYPLTVPMCSPLTDGAAAVVVTSGQAVPSAATARAVRVLASSIGTGVDRDLDDYSRHVAKLTADRAYEQGGVGPGDVDVAEVHDATAFGEILQSELLGLCEPGAGGPAASAGETSLGGRIPINPSGGLESKGHPLAATGLGQVYELVTQLRGEAGPRQVDRARIAVAENGGGYFHGEEATAAVTILGR